MNPHRGILAIGRLLPIMAIALTLRRRTTGIAALPHRRLRGVIHLHALTTPRDLADLPRHLATPRRVAPVELLTEAVPALLVVVAVVAALPTVAAPPAPMVVEVPALHTAVVAAVLTRTAKTRFLFNLGCPRCCSRLGYFRSAHSPPLPSAVSFSYLHSSLYNSFCSTVLHIVTWEC
jgi:hypothetical protein